MVDWDVVVVGRSYAGLSAALTLGRSRRSTLVIGDGPPRNEAAAHAHGLLTRDHIPASELIAQAEDDLDRYDTVVLERGHVDHITGAAGAFTVTFGDHTTTAASVILATGVNDDIPAIAGLADLWGRGVYTCPFCDGFENADRPWALVGDHIEPFHIANLCNWTSSLTVLHPDPDGSLRAALEQLPFEASVDTRPIRRVRRSGDDITVEFSDGAEAAFRAIFVSAAPVPNNGLAIELGCDVDDDGFVPVDPMGATNIAGVHAIGDLTRRGPHQISLAAADGMMAAMVVASEATRARLAGASTHAGVAGSPSDAGTDTGRSDP